MQTAGRPAVAVRPVDRRAARRSGASTVVDLVTGAAARLRASCGP
jgi:hypothetical protein